MALQKFNFAALAEIDEGRLRIMFDLLLEKVRLDCVDRPALNKARSVSLNVSLTPKADQHGNLITVDVSLDVKESTPKRVSPTYNMVPQRNGIAFNDASVDNARQGTLDDAGAKMKAVGAVGGGS